MKKAEVFLWLNNALNTVGMDIRRYPYRHQRALLKYLQDNEVDYCIDAGANTGQYAGGLRSAGYKGKIVSFEPQKKAYSKLQKKAAKDGNWDAVNAGLGHEDATAILNISGNSVSSSILDMSDTLSKSTSEAAYIDKEEIKVFRLDTFIKSNSINKKIFLKIDAQGYESKILEGAEKCFNNIYALQLETAFVTLYKGEMLFNELQKEIESKGFYLSSIEGGFYNETDGRLLQADVIFLRGKSI